METVRTYGSYSTSFEVLKRTSEALRASEENNEWIKTVQSTSHWVFSAYYDTETFISQRAAGKKIWCSILPARRESNTQPWGGDFFPGRTVLPDPKKKRGGEKISHMGKIKAGNYNICLSCYLCAIVYVSPVESVLKTDISKNSCRWLTLEQWKSSLAACHWTNEFVHEWKASFAASSWETEATWKIEQHLFGCGERRRLIGWILSAVRAPRASAGEIRSAGRERDDALRTTHHFERRIVSIFCKSTTLLLASLTSVSSNRGYLLACSVTPLPNFLSIVSLLSARCPRTKYSPGKVPGNVKARLHMRFFMRFRCDFGAILRTKPAPAYWPRTGF